VEAIRPPVPTFVAVAIVIRLPRFRRFSNVAARDAVPLHCGTAPVEPPSQSMRNIELQCGEAGSDVDASGDLRRAWPGSREWLNRACGPIRATGRA
jgi:hypothetical protein